MPCFRFNVFLWALFSRNFLTVSLSRENGDTVLGRNMNHSPCDVDQRRCSDLRYENFNCSTHAVEPRTGIEFPTILDNIFGGTNSSFNTEVLLLIFLSF